MMHIVRWQLRRGFTTLRAVGAFGCCGYVFHNVRAAIEQGYYIGARMVISQGCCTPGSHGDYVKSLGPVPELIQDYGQRHVCMGNGPEFFRAALREQRRLGYDFAKIMATGGFATEGDSPVDQQLGDDELQMIMATAHELGMGVTAHAYFPALVTKLAEFGIDGIEHAALIDKTTATLLEQKDVYVVPTFMPYLSFPAFADSWAQLVLNLGCAAGLLAALPAASIQLLKEQDWLDGVLSLIMAALVAGAMTGII